MGERKSVNTCTEFIEVSQSDHCIQKHAQMINIMS
jgi:hypothetical protein